MADELLEYLPVRIGTLRPGGTVRFDIYIRVADRHLHYMHKGDSLEEKRFTALKKKNVKKMFIRIEDEPAYLEYLEDGINGVTDSKIAVEQRADVARDTLRTEAEKVEKSLETEAGFRKTEGRIGKIVEFLTTEKTGLKSILGASGVAEDLYHHSANVSTLSLSLASALGITDNKDLINLGVAALLHDIGKTKIKLPLNLAREEMTPEQLKIYKTHPQAATDLLSSKPFVTPQILRLILDHEEVGDGQGFPERKKIDKLPLNSQVLNLCNEFDRLSIQRKVPPLEIMNLFFQEKADLFSLDLIEQLNKLITNK